MQHHDPDNIQDNGMYELSKSIQKVNSFRIEVMIYWTNVNFYQLES